MFCFFSASISFSACRASIFLVWSKFSIYNTKINITRPGVRKVKAKVLFKFSLKIRTKEQCWTVTPFPYLHGNCIWSFLQLIQQSSIRLNKQEWWYSLWTWWTATAPCLPITILLEIFYAYLVEGITSCLKLRLDGGCPTRLNYGLLPPRHFWQNLDFDWDLFDQSLTKTTLKDW